MTARWTAPTPLAWPEHLPCTPESSTPLWVAVFEGDLNANRELRRLRDELKDVEISRDQWRQLALLLAVACAGLVWALVSSR